MTYKKQTIADVCKLVAPKYQFEPIQLYAVARQESAKDKDGNFDASIPRLEQGFFENYINGNHELPVGLPTTAQALLATSYGCWQIMGYELWRLGYIKAWYDDLLDAGWKATLQQPYSQISILQSIDAFCVDTQAQCEYACKLLSEKRATANKAQSFKGVTDKEEMTYLYYNGGGDADYGKKILHWKSLGMD